MQKMSIRKNIELFSMTQKQQKAGNISLIFILKSRNKYKIIQLI